MAVKIVNFSKPIKRDNLPLVIGYFGCVHVMHQQLLTKYQQFNVLTFTDLMNKKDHQIYSYKFRIQNLKKYHPKNIYVLDISNHNMTGVEFLNKFLLPLDPSIILVGEDFEFGSDHSKARILKHYFKVSELGYNSEISTSKIFDLFAAGKIDQANDYMAFNLYFNNKWVKGLKQGRKLGFPTINLNNEKPFILPEGSYISFTKIGKKKYKSITFVGRSKTIKHNQPTIESHILGKKILPRWMYPFWIRNDIRVEFLKYIRPNAKHNSKYELQQAIAADVNVATKYFKEHNI